MKRTSYLNLISPFSKKNKFSTVSTFFESVSRFDFHISNELLKRSIKTLLPFPFIILIKVFFKSFSISLFDLAEIFNLPITSLSIISSSDIPSTAFVKRAIKTFFFTILARLSDSVVSIQVFVSIIGNKPK